MIYKMLLAHKNARTRTATKNDRDRCFNTALFFQHHAMSFIASKATTLTKDPRNQ